jgi:uncharacterized protein YbaA (DUF1428 family)
MPYVDGFVLPVPKKNLKAYFTMAKKAGKIWREHGAGVTFRNEIEVAPAGDRYRSKTLTAIPSSCSSRHRRSSTALTIY